jgi:hypothetical protein
MAVAWAGDLFTGFALNVIRWVRENIDTFLFPEELVRDVK